MTLSCFAISQQSVHHRKLLSISIAELRVQAHSEFGWNFGEKQVANRPAFFPQRWLLGGNRSCGLASCLRSDTIAAISRRKKEIPPNNLADASCRAGHRRADATLENLAGSTPVMMRRDGMLSDPVRTTVVRRDRRDD